MINKTLYITDLDDTFLNAEAAVGRDVQERLNCLIKKGVLFTFITARDWDSAHTIMKDSLINIPVAVFNGSVVMDFARKKIITGNYISRTSGRKLLEILLKNRTIVTVNYNKNSEVHRKVIDCDHEWISGEMDNILSCSAVTSTSGIAGLDYQVRKRSIPGITINIYSDPFDKDIKVLDILPSQASKGAAVRMIRKIFGHDRITSTVAFGNGDNDIEMFKAADVGIGVGETTAGLNKYAGFHLAYDGGLSIIDYIEHDVKWKGGKG